LSALAGTGRGLYFNGTNPDYVSFASNFVLNIEFSIHSWVYTLPLSTGRGNMTLFSKDRNGSPNANDISFMSFGVNSSLQFHVGLQPTHPSGTAYSVKTSTMTLAVNSWTYLKYHIRTLNSLNTEV
jgi:hypothetical protein